jgi:hypothetical protein
MSDQQQWPSAPPPPMGYGYGTGMVQEVRPELEVAAPEPQRRWTVLLRWLLLIPQWIVLVFLSIAAFFVTVVGWFAAVFTGRLPDGIADFLTGFLGYSARVMGYEMLLVDKYPPFSFTAPDYPIQVSVQPGELNRLAVLFRIILMIPAYIVLTVLSAGWHAVGWIIWLVTLILGRMPDFVWGATAGVLRYRPDGAVPPGLRRVRRDAGSHGAPQRPAAPYTRSPADGAARGAPATGGP